MLKLSRISVLSVALAFGAISCGPPDPDEPDGGGVTSNWTVCGVLNADLAAEPAEFWPEGDTYGCNSFYIWRLSRQSSDCAADYCYYGTKTPVETRLPYENWQIPATEWSAIRMNWDGLDPYKFRVSDPFYFGYLPMVSWQSKTGAVNDGTCPESDGASAHVCIGKHQLDPQAPALSHGSAYLVQMSMLVPLGMDEATHYRYNRVQSCYRQVIEY